MDNKITYNGKVYNSINDLPPEARMILEDKDGNNIPDVFDGLLDSAKEFKDFTNITASTYVVDGKTYNSLDDIPADKLEMIMEKLGKLSEASTKPFDNKTDFETTGNNLQTVNKPSGLENASKELSSNFPFKLIMLFIFLLFMIFFIYSLIRMLSR